MGRAGFGSFQVVSAGSGHSVFLVTMVNQDYSRLHTHTEIYQICKCDYSEEIAYCTEPEIGNTIHKTTGENR